MQAADTLLTGSLEDYLETIYEVVRERKVARVRDIAAARSVRAASVTPAMHRLSEQGLIRYARREFIELTPAGEAAARRVLARHHLLTRFLREVLSMPAPAAEHDACAMEHCLSDEGVDHLVRFFEFLEVCQEGRDFLRQFHQCPVAAGSGPCDGEVCGNDRAGEEATGMSLSDLKPGDQVEVEVEGVGWLTNRVAGA